MDAQLRELLNRLKQSGDVKLSLLGIFHVLVGRQIRQADGTLVCAGLTWRELSATLKQIRWDKEAVRELGIEPARLPPRDRQRYWYAALSLTRLDSDEAIAAGNQVADYLATLGYEVSPPPKKSE
ncbi:MAG: hypothetical protein ACK4RK_08825 [Gemmataceae bacterium]